MIMIIIIVVIINFLNFPKMKSNFIKGAFIFVLGLMINIEAFAQESTDDNPRKTKEMERVMVIGSSKAAHNIAGSAQYLDLKDIETYNYNDINRVLRQVPGVNIQEEEGYGNRPNIGLRGGRSERSADITLMEDGILIAPAPYAEPEAYYFPRVNRMEAIEVRKGSSTIKFGPRTTNGAINLISSSIPSKPQGKALIGIGSNNAQRAEVNYGATHGRFGYVLDIGHEQTDGFKEIDVVGGDTGFSIQDIMAKFRVTSDPKADIYQHVEFKFGATKEDSNETYLGISQSDFDQNPYRRYAGSQVDYLDTNHAQFHVRHYIEPTENTDITTTIYRNNFERKWHKLKDVTVGGTKEKIANIFSENIQGHIDALKGLTDLAGDGTNNLRVKANNRKYYSQGIQSIVGHQFKTKNTEHDLEMSVRYHYDSFRKFDHEDLYSITNGIMQLQSSGSPGSAGNLTNTAKATAVFIEDEISTGKWKIVPGLRYENIDLESDDKKDNANGQNNVQVLLPGLGVAYNLNKNTNLFTSIHKGFAPPAPSTGVGKRAEESINYEAGIKFNKDNLNLELVGFYNDYSNLLGADRESSGGGGTGDQFNGGEVDVYGLEAALQYDLSDFIENSKFKYPVNLNYTYTRAEFRNNFTSDFSEWGDVSKGDELPYLPTHQLYASIGIESEKWLVAVAGKFISEMRVTAGQGQVARNDRIDKHLVVDVTAEYEIFDNARIFTSIYNITDQKYVASRRPAGARPGAPLTILSGVKFTF